MASELNSVVITPLNLDKQAIQPAKAQIPININCYDRDAKEEGAHCT